MNSCWLAQSQTIENLFKTANTKLVVKLTACGVGVIYCHFSVMEFMARDWTQLVSFEKKLMPKNSRCFKSIVVVMF